MTTTSKTVNDEFKDVLKKLEDLNIEALNFSNDIKLDFYKYYKQATVGDCNIERPWTIYFKECAKWDAWNSIKGMTTEAAMTNYIDCYKTHISY
jgi:diazepam-binding inhibitor (GABA receptor modulating acyl-CoA-binding protein)